MDQYVAIILRSAVATWSEDRLATEPSIAHLADRGLAQCAIILEEAPEEWAMATLGSHGLGTGEGSGIAEAERQPCPAVVDARELARLLCKHSLGHVPRDGVHTPLREPHGLEGDILHLEKIELGCCAPDHDNFPSGLVFECVHHVKDHLPGPWHFKPGYLIASAEARQEAQAHGAVLVEDHRRVACHGAIQIQAERTVEEDRVAPRDGHVVDHDTVREGHVGAVHLLALRVPNAVV
mmetsp:Transcript_52217/g.111716  ORF Transcript_52217/g.111716 Transcript_52217/m.111716 type:complete len:237 (+) Transcript_52217:196-906(+)